MGVYILLFRGINVGGRNKLPMKDLVSLLEEFGFEDIQTLIQSGNVVLRSSTAITDKTIEDIANKIESSHGFNPEILLLSFEELQQTIDQCPFNVDDGKTLHFFFFDQVPPDPDLEKLESLKRRYGTIFN